MFTAYTWEVLDFAEILDVVSVYFFLSHFNLYIYTVLACGVWGFMFVLSGIQSCTEDTE